MTSAKLQLRLVVISLGLLCSHCLDKQALLSSKTAVDAPLPTADALFTRVGHSYGLSDSELSLIKGLGVNLFELAAERSKVRNGRFKDQIVNDGIPEGVECEVTLWCDAANLCSRVCQRGTVKVAPWLSFALDYQWQLARQQPFCYAQLPGSHNSAITLADGYGTRDPVYQGYLKQLGLLSQDQTLVTNNQALSLTDQLNLGLRFIELDVHYIQGAFKISHCGGFHSPDLNKLVQLLNIVAKMFGHPIQWDSETLGCMPSLSSIPTGDQRPFTDALAEVAAWLARPDNANEFLMVYLDNNPDVLTWGKLLDLIAELNQFLPVEEVMTPPELKAWQDAHEGRMPTINDMVAAGKRVMLMSRANYGADMAGLMFSHWQPCNFTEPAVASFSGTENCTMHNPRAQSWLPMMAGRLYRIVTCHLRYGPLNCDFVRGVNEAQLDTVLMPQVMSCGLNVPSPDLITPALMATTVWSWAPGHPPAAPEIESRGLQAGPQCTVMASVDGRWYVQTCDVDMEQACRRLEPVTGGGDVLWVLSQGQACPEGYGSDIPHTPRENLDLTRLAQATSAEFVQLSALQAPDYLPVWLKQQAAVQRVSV